jgi:integrase
MAGRQAKIISESTYKDLLVFAATTRYPLRNRLLVLLSLKAGLRAGEIANLTWDMVLDPHGEVGTVIELRDCAAKKRSGRSIPIHPGLHDGLVAWRKSVLPIGALIRSERGQGMRPVSIVNWFAKAYRAIGTEGCSSHSGRRTFITRAARLAYKAGGCDDLNGDRATSSRRKKDPPKEASAAAFLLRRARPHGSHHLSGLLLGRRARADR